jgi:SAM-dependent methyltransferase
VSRLSYNKVCNVEDFKNEDLRRIMRRELPHEVSRFGAEFPSGHEDRKDWETAMTIRTFEDHGLLDGRRDFLGVASGTEALNFCLTRHGRRVVATDLHLDPGDWGVTATSVMLRDPGAYWASDWNPRRLVIQHMNALELQYEDETFDGIFSSSSIEHFGDYHAIHRTMDEMFRVLRPGGIAALSTEFRLRGPSPGIPGTLMFDREQLLEHVVGTRPWSLLSPLDDTVSDETMRSALDVVPLVDLQVAFVAEHPDGYAIRPEYPKYPVVALESPSGHISTSVHLALRKKPRNPLARVLPARAVKLVRRR